MSSNLRVNNILPSVGTNVAIGTAGGSITLTGSVSGSITSGTISGVSTAGITTAYITTLSGISTISASAAIAINQNLVFASGKGIDFSATTNSSGGTMTSELFNDYEEGTWTPYWSASSGANLFVNNDLSIHNGTYTKIGNICYYIAHFDSDASFSYNTAAGVSGSSQAYIGGLPFTAAPFTAGGGASGYNAGFVGYFNQLTSYDTPNYGYTPMIITEAGNTLLRLQYPTTNGVGNWTANFLLNALSSIIVGGFYKIP